MTHFGHNFSKYQFNKKAGHWFNRNDRDDRNDRNDRDDAPAPTPTKPIPTPAPPSDSTGQTPTQLETAFLKLINEDRAEAGAKALTIDSELVFSARAHSAWMDKTNTFSHTGENGSSPSDRIEDAGYGAVRTAENIAYIGGSRANVLDLPDVVQLHTNLMNSPGHKANLMNPNLTEIGIGLKQGEIKGMSAIFVTQNFGTPNKAEAAESDGVGLVGIQAAETDAFHA